MFEKFPNAVVKVHTYFSDIDIWIGDRDLPKNYPVKEVTQLVGYDDDGNEITSTQKRDVTMEIDGVVVTATNFEMSVTEARNYIECVEKNAGEPLKIEVALCPDGKVDLHYTIRGQRFERIRRITGYLTGDLNTWNNSKRAEESERVKHGVNFN